MNAPLPEAIRKALESVTLDDKYSLESGRAFMSGVQALVRLPMLQRKRDALAGLNTAAFISGYRGSPLGAYDQALWAGQEASGGAEHRVPARRQRRTRGHRGVGHAAARPLSAEQEVRRRVRHLVRQGPGVDRSSDVFKHANMAGTAKHGGVIAIAGDDHVAKSSTAAHQSDHIFKACGLPVFFPSSVQDILDMGLHALAMSRFAGVWTAMKTIQEVVESSSSVSVDPRAREHRAAARLRDAAGRRAHPLARRGARAGGAAVRLQVVRRVGLRARQPAQPQRHRRPEWWPR